VLQGFGLRPATLCALGPLARGPLRSPLRSDLASPAGQPILISLYCTYLVRSRCSLRFLSGPGLLFIYCCPVLHIDRYLSRAPIPFSQSSFGPLCTYLFLMFSCISLGRIRTHMGSALFVFLAQLEWGEIARLQKIALDCRRFCALHSFFVDVCC